MGKKYIYNCAYILGSISIFLYLVKGPLVFLILFYFFSLFGFFSDKISIKKLFLFTLSFLLISLFGFFNVNFKDNEYFLTIFSFISCMGTALLLFRSSSSVNLTKYHYIFFALYVCFFVNQYGFIDPELYNDIFASSSRNIVSAYLNLLLISYVISCYRFNVTPSIFLPLFNIFICFFLYGRTGIVLSILLLLTIFIKFFYSKINLFICIFFAIFVFLGYSIVEFYFLEKTGFVQGAISERSIVFNEYVGSLNDYKNIIFGSNIYNCCSYLASLNFNLHNSFLFAHSRFGLVGILFVVGLFVLIFKSKNILYITLFLLICFRYFYDQLGFFQIFDVTLFYLLISVLNISKNTNYKL